jgi:hypothetical protein
MKISKIIKELEIKDKIIEYIDSDDFQEKLNELIFEKHELKYYSDGTYVINVKNQGTINNLDIVNIDEKLKDDYRFLDYIYTLQNEVISQKAEELAEEINIPIGFYGRSGGYVGIKEKDLSLNTRDFNYNKILRQIIHELIRDEVIVKLYTEYIKTQAKELFEINTKHTSETIFDTLKAECEDISIKYIENNIIDNYENYSNIDDSKIKLFVKRVYESIAEMDDNFWKEIIESNLKYYIPEQTNETDEDYYYNEITEQDTEYYNIKQTA